MIVNTMADMTDQVDIQDFLSVLWKCVVLFLSNHTKDTSSEWHYWEMQSHYEGHG